MLFSDPQGSISLQEKNGIRRQISIPLLILGRASHLELAKEIAM
jgi:hypothetical protein